MHGEYEMEKRSFGAGLRLQMPMEDWQVLDAEHMRKMGSCFKRATASGAFADIARVAGPIGELPTQMFATIMPGLPQPEGGHRFRGLLTDALRVYDKCHKRVQGEWLARTSR
eukprot:6707217-Pyramimonas_sp.AAC.1